MWCSFSGHLDAECCEIVKPLSSFSADEICIILSEVGLKPFVPLARYNNYSICTSHYNVFLKLNTRRSRRKLCQIPSLVSSHPSIDNTKEDGLRSLPSRTHMKSASRGLKEKDILHFINQAGITLPVNTPCCTMCLKKIREENVWENDTSWTENASSEEKQVDNENSSCTIAESHVDDDHAPHKMTDAEKPINHGKFGHLEYETIQSEQMNQDMMECTNEIIQATTDAEKIEDDQLCDGFTETSSCCSNVGESSMEFLSQLSTQSLQNAHDLHQLNTFLEGVGIKRFSEEGRDQWSSYSKSARSGYLGRFRTIIEKIVSCVFQKDVDEILKILLTSEKEQKSACIVPAGTFGPLVHAYQEAESWRNRRQILSFMTQTLTYKEVTQLLPDLIENKYYSAKNHAKNVGPGLPVTAASSRQRMDPVKLDSFLDFITSPHIIRDLPFGERKIKMSDGSIHETPNVIRCMGSSDVIQQYKVYCAENNTLPLGDSTMYKILAQCGAQIRTSLEGIDYFVAEGGRAFRTITDTLEQLVKMQKINQQQHKDFSSLLLKCKQYLRADYKVHISADSEVADHCQRYALSDPARPEFSCQCQHSHNLICVSCEQLKDATSSLLKVIQCNCTDGETELMNDLDYKVKQAVQSIENLKKHILRCKNQDAAKSELFDNMKPHEILLICDWSMKYLPRKFREDQCDWFGKRGLPWHITVAFRRTETAIESLGFVHIFQSQISQDSVTTAAVIIDVMKGIHSIDSSASFHLWSDNAGCYKSTEMMALLYTQGSVITYNFCESQNGKGPCDRTGATLKSGIRRYVNQGNDVLTANSMKEAIEKTAKNVKYRVSVVHYHPEKTTFKPIPAIASYSNFSFEEDGIRVWKSYGIGSGLLIKKESIPVIPFHPLVILQGSDEACFHVTRVTGSTHLPSPEESQLHCTNEGCVASFETTVELSNHLLIGKCKLEFDLRSSSNADVTKRKYLEKVSESSVINMTVSVQAETELLEEESSLHLGWALKEERRNKRFNQNQRDFLTEKFNVGVQTGRKEDPFLLAESMLYVKKEDGSRRFTYEEVLSVQQITSFFSRMSRKNKSAQDDDWEAKKETEISKISEEL